MKGKLKRVFGFLSDSRGIAQRYGNEIENWEKHLKNTREIILSEAANKEKKLCLILGSGMCADVPLEELSNIFDKIVLADVVHPEVIKYKTKNNERLETKEADLSGLMNYLYDVKKKRRKFDMKSLNFYVLKEIIEDINPDYVVSVNLLSQISYFPAEFAKKHKLADVEEIEKMKKLTESAHIDSLPAGKSLLITDCYEYEYNFKGNKINEKTRLSIKLPEEKIIKEWIWDFDLSGNYETGNPVKFKVVALRV